MDDAPALTPAVAALVDVSAALATRDAALLRTALRRALPVAEAGAVEEAILQAHLFVGFPDALNAMHAWREVSGRPAPAALAADAALWPARGSVVCHTVYAGNYEKLRANVRALHPELDEWMVTGGYGRVLGRPGLALPLRELCIAALLAVWNAPRQLHSHLRGALNAGAAVAAVDAALDIATAYLAPPAAAEVRSLWAAVRERAPRTAEE